MSAVINPAKTSGDIGRNLSEVGLCSAGNKTRLAQWAYSSFELKSDENTLLISWSYSSDNNFPDV